MNNTEEKIIQLLTSTNRKGMDAMIGYLKAEGFFEAPASTKFHGAYPGGLANHSLRVYELLTGFNNMLMLGTGTGSGQEPLPLTQENITIAALLHDVCKIGAIGIKKPYKWNRGQPKGHALLSIARIKEYIELTEIEELIITYHMGVYGLNEFYKEDDWQSGEFPLRGDESKSKEERRGKSLANAWYHNPVVKVMYFCDEIATLEEKAN